MKDEWQVLDLRSRNTCGPFDDELICLHLIPKLSCCREQFVVGRMVTEEGKSWLKPEGGGNWNISALKKRYLIEWVLLPETNRKES